jgi:hypothetical protein
MSHACTYALRAPAPAEKHEGPRAGKLGEGAKLEDMCEPPPHERDLNAMFRVYGLGCVCVSLSLSLSLLRAPLYLSRARARSLSLSLCLSLSISLSLSLSLSLYQRVSDSDDVRGICLQLWHKFSKFSA